MSFGIALSGIAAAQSELATTSNNIANSETSGFKESRAQFSELYATSQLGVAQTQVGNGVKVSSIAQQFTQGDIESTGDSLDVAISGNGFFVLSNSGTTVYSRSGAFKTDDDGDVVNDAGDYLQVYPTVGDDGFNTSTLTNLKLQTSDSAPNATTSVDMVFNLPSSASAPTTTTFDPSDTSSYNKSTTLTVYDSLGSAHAATMYFVKDSTTTNTWNSYLYVDGTQVGSQELTYSSTGALTTPADGKVSYGTYTPTTGADPLSMSFDLSKTTQYGSSWSINSATQDGYTTGTLTGISIDTSGVVQARFTNGRSVNLGKLAIASFPAETGLQPLSDTTWGQTYASGQPIYGEAGTSGMGSFQSGSLEKSNVDVTTQLVNMITAQRYFQANAQMISTEDQITQTIINIR